MVELLVTGAGGQLGRAVLRRAVARGLAAVGAARREVPVEDAAAVRAWVGNHRPRAVVHCAAWTDVDGCEADEARALRVNGGGTANVAAACLATGAGMVGVSTDYVFDGRAIGRGIREDDPTGPISAYGRSKLAGEDAVRAAFEGFADCRAGAHIVRTSWVFGPGGRNFPAAILNRARRGGPLRVVTDQIGSPTMTLDLADALLDLATSDAASGVWHAANEGSCSWHDFAVEVLREAGLGHVQVGSETSAALARPAPRPAWSVLDCSRLAALRGRALPHWLDALRRHLEEELK